jgi:hypothetical protein
MRRERTLSPDIRLHNLHTPGEQDEKRDIGIVGLEQYLSELDLSQLGAKAHSIDLRGGQNRKSLSIMIERAGGNPRRHGFPLADKA